MWNEILSVCVVVIFQIATQWNRV